MTYATDPGWTPLIINSGGVVLEVGGMLQHGALVSREFNKPCVVGIDNVANKAIIGECKFKNEVIDKEVYESLINRKGLIDKRYEEVGLMFFSLSGYSKWVKENADPNNTQLITLEDMYPF